MLAYISCDELIIFNNCLLRAMPKQMAVQLGPKARLFFVLIDIDR